MSTNTPQTGFQLGNNLYDRAKFIVQVFLPALGVLYATIAQLFEFGGTAKVLGVLAAVGLFIGTVMRISANNYDPPPVTGTPVGSFVIKEDPETGKKVVTLGELNQDPADFINGDVISFHVAKEPPEVTLEEKDRDENSH